MSILVYCENAGSKFKKSTFEALTYASDLSAETGGEVIALSIGKVADDDLKQLANYGASKILNASNAKLEKFTSMAYSNVISEAVHAEKAVVVVISSSFTGKGLAPRVAVRLEAGFVDNVITLPDTSQGFRVRKNAFSGKAFADVEITSAVKVIGLVPNTYKKAEKSGSVNIVSFDPSIDDKAFSEEVKETIRATNKVPLPEAERVVSGGRGLKGPENWGMIEELAEVLDAATACSKPVSDAHWRPHSEHVGQTGIAISPNLYVAIGISGAIQHLAGVSASKTIVVINKDPEAPFFKSADYGVVGDAFEVVPKLIEAIKKFKSVNS
jgi:electron transfer flavoprotein alpha subunit